MAVGLFAACCWIGMILRHGAREHFVLHSSLSAPAADFFDWMLMVGAMMLPTTLPAIDDVVRRSYRRRRWRATLEYAVGYSACWGIAGVAFALLRLHPSLHDRRIAALACLLAAVWAFLPARRIWFARCHRQIPLGPVGWRADWDALRQGAAHGVPCIPMCWLLMAACGIADHDWLVMLGATALAIWEKRMFRPYRPPNVVGSLIFAAWLFAIASPHPDSVASPSFHRGH